MRRVGNDVSKATYCYIKITPFFQATFNTRGNHNRTKLILLFKYFFPGKWYFRIFFVNSTGNLFFSTIALDEWFGNLPFISQTKTHYNSCQTKSHSGQTCIHIGCDVSVVQAFQSGYLPFQQECNEFQVLRLVPTARLCRLCTPSCGQGKKLFGTEPRMIFLSECREFIISSRCLLTVRGLSQLQNSMHH